MVERHFFCSLFTLSNVVILDIWFCWTCYPCHLAMRLQSRRYYVSMSSVSMAIEIMMIRSRWFSRSDKFEDPLPSHCFWGDHGCYVVRDCYQAIHASLDTMRIQVSFVLLHFHHVCFREGSPCPDSDAWMFVSRRLGNWPNGQQLFSAHGISVKCDAEENIW